MTTARSPRLILLLLVLITALGAILRVQVVTQTSVIDPIRADARKYVLYAWNLTQLGTYSWSDAALQGQPEDVKPDALVTPGYPLFLSLFLDKDVSDSSYARILLAQAALSALTVLLAYWLFSTVVGPLPALLVALLTALSPHLISMNAYLLTETLFCFWLVAFVAVMARPGVRTRPSLLLLAGVLLGAATLTRPWLQGFALISVLFLALSGERIPWRRAFLLLAGFALLVGPWIGRNLATLGVPTDTTLSATSFYHGSFPDMMWEDRPETRGFPYRFDPRAAELSASPQAAREAVWERARERPWDYLRWYSIGKLTTVFSWSIVAGVGDVFVYPVEKTPFATAPHFRRLHDLMQWLHAPLTALGLLACALVWLRESRLPIKGEALWVARLLSLLFAYFILLHLIGFPCPRYSIPLRPLLYGMAVTGVVVLWGWTRRNAHA